MRIVIRGNSSSWCKCGKWVPQGSVLEPIVFQVHIGHMTEGLNNYYFDLFAGLCKIGEFNKEPRRLQGATEGY